MSSNSDYVQVDPETRRPPRMPPPAAQRPVEPVEVPSKSPSQLIAGAIWVATLLAAALLGLRQEAPATAAASSSATPAATEPEKTSAAAEPEKSTPAPTEAVAGNVQELQSQLDRLSAQTKELQSKVDGLPKPDASLEPMERKVDELAKSVAVVMPLSKKVDKLDEQVSGLNDAVKTMKNELSGLADQIKSLATAKPAEPAVLKDEEPKSATAEAPALSEGVDLFKAGKYKEAGEVFKRIEAATPNDARVYYYEALVNGLTTGQWQADTLKIAAKGAALEKSGTTSPTTIDEAVSDLPANLKRWVVYFRTQAK